MNKPSKLQKVVEQEARENARNGGHGQQYNGITGAPPSHLRAELSRQALEKFDYEFKNILSVWFNEGSAKDFVAIPKAFAKHPFFGNTRVLKELCMCMSEIGGNNSDLIEELVLEYRFDGNKPGLKHKLLFIQEPAKHTDAELFWLTVLAYSLNVWAPAFKKLMYARLFSKDAAETIDEIDFHKVIDSGSTDEKMSEMDMCIAVQYDEISELCQQLG